MLSVLYPIVDVICIIILSFLGLQNEKYSNVGRKQYCVRLLLISIGIYTLFDVFWGFLASYSYQKTDLILYIATINILSGGYISTLWLRFVFFYIGFNENLFKKKKRLGVFYLPFLIQAGLLIYNLFSKSFFYVSDEGMYERTGNNFVFIIFGIQIFYYILTFIWSLGITARKEKLNLHIKLAIHIFSLIPAIFSIVQLILPELPFYAVGLMLAVFEIFIFDLIDEREVASNRTIFLQQRQVFEKCNEILNQPDSVQRNLNTLLSLILSYYNADRTYIIEYKDEEQKLFECKYEYCKPGISKVIQGSDDIQASFFAPCIEKIKNKTVYSFTDVESFVDSNPDLLNIFKNNNITSGVSTPIKMGGKFCGFLAIDNPRVFDQNYTILRTITIFIHSELLRRYQLEVEQKTSGAVLLALAAEYSSVYYINAENGELRPYRYDSTIKKYYGDLYKNKISYKAAFEMYLEDFVDEQDRETLKPFGDIEFLCKKLQNRKNIKKQYLCHVNGREQYYQAKWVKVDKENEDATAFVLGFANIDEQVRSKELLLEQKKVLKKQQEELNTAKEKAQDAERISQIDRLTGLYNKISGQTLITEYIQNKSENEKYALIFIDIDKFKDFNDKFGHLIGDEILMEVGQAIKSNCRQNDIPIRFGGDEFVILLRNQRNESAAVKKASEIQKELSELTIGKEWTLTCSIGIYITTTSDFDGAVEKADEALYDVKESGRNNVKIIQ